QIKPASSCRCQSVQVIYSGRFRAYHSDPQCSRSASMSECLLICAQPSMPISTAFLYSSSVVHFSYFEKPPLRPEPECAIRAALSLRIPLLHNLSKRASSSIDAPKLNVLMLQIS